MTLTPERIAEIEADGMCTMEDETAELIRLARLGLRVRAECIIPARSLTGFRDLPMEWHDKLISFVMLEDSK